MSTKKTITAQRVREFVGKYKKNQYVYFQAVCRNCGGIRTNIHERITKELMLLCKEGVLEEVPQYMCPRCTQLHTLEFLQELDENTLQCISCEYIFKKEIALMRGIYRKK